jgi:4-carboxymuconolactone decarboxylase
MGISILMGGGPAVIYACEAIEALEQFVSAGLEPASPEPERK